MSYANSKNVGIINLFKMTRRKIMEQNQIVEILKHHNVSQIYHADTVITSLSFLKAGGLCSRQYLDRNSLPKTSQYTDCDDQKFNVYNDLFFDSVDIHGRIRKPNYYGPVLFVFDLQMLLQENLANRIFITKSNPCYWKPYLKCNDRYFTNLDELGKEFQKGDFKQMITCHQVGFANFKYLQKIILDRPPEKHIELFRQAYQALFQGLQEADLSVPLNIRKCEYCKCFNEYQNMGENNLMRLFATKGVF